ncbi:hypothetical protein HK100_006100 [Physocladia obscura]|uniref:Uncharacterized protein n=1 Tax=Physocladia obscura TaxID=109957 RepID=A0AAD5XCU4_9FUNG|nr:hypothetical protein HK100_006100 [Physocladia obscura]
MQSSKALAGSVKVAANPVNLQRTQPPKSTLPEIIGTSTVSNFTGDQTKIKEFYKHFRQLIFKSNIRYQFLYEINERWEKYVLEQVTEVSLQKRLDKILEEQDSARISAGPQNEIDLVKKVLASPDPMPDEIRFKFSEFLQREIINSRLRNADEIQVSFLRERELIEFEHYEKALEESNDLNGLCNAMFRQGYDIFLKKVQELAEDKIFEAIGFALSGIPGCPSQLADFVSSFGKFLHIAEEIASSLEDIIKDSNSFLVLLIDAQQTLSDAAKYEEGLSQHEEISSKHEEVLSIKIQKQASIGETQYLSDFLKRNSESYGEQLNECHNMLETYRKRKERNLSKSKIWERVKDGIKKLESIKTEVRDHILLHIGIISGKTLDAVEKGFKTFKELQAKNDNLQEINRTYEKCAELIAKIRNKIKETVKTKTQTKKYYRFGSHLIFGAIVYECCEDELSKLSTLIKNLISLEAKGHQINLAFFTSLNLQQVEDVHLFGKLQPERLCGKKKVVFLHSVDKEPESSNKPGSSKNKFDISDKELESARKKIDRNGEETKPKKNPSYLWTVGLDQDAKMLQFLHSGNDHNLEEKFRMKIDSKILSLLDDLEMLNFLNRLEF